MTTPVNLHPISHIYNGGGGKCHLLTTLECTILEELTRGDVENEVLVKIEADGEDFWCNDDAAAAVKPKDDWKEAKGKRRKAKENTVGGSRRGTRLSGGAGLNKELWQSQLKDQIV